MLAIIDPAKRVGNIRIGGFFVLKSLRQRQRLVQVLTIFRIETSHALARLPRRRRFAYSGVVISLSSGKLFSLQEQPAGIAEQAGLMRIAVNSLVVFAQGFSIAATLAQYVGEDGMRIPVIGETPYQLAASGLSVVEVALLLI